jgi:hypothetical protein
MIEQHVFYKTVKLRTHIKTEYMEVHNSFYEFYTTGLKMLKHVAKFKVNHLRIVLTEIYFCH